MRFVFRHNHRHCEERSDEAIQEPKALPWLWIVSLRSQ